MAAIHKIEGESDKAMASETLWTVRKWLVTLLGIAGVSIANWVLGQGWIPLGDASTAQYVSQTIAALVVNLGTLLFMAGWNLISRFDRLMELISLAVGVVEEQMSEKPGTEKLEAAYKEADRLMEEKGMNWFTRIAVRPLLRMMLSNAAKPLKALLYKDPIDLVIAKSKRVEN